MKELLRTELVSDGMFTNNIPKILDNIVKAIPNQNINYRMKLTIAVSELMTFASHLRRNIRHWNDSSIPINAITFSIAASGDGKDSAANAARKCFKTGYSIIEDKRKEMAKQKAIHMAQTDGLENPGDWEVYKDYYNAPNDLFVSPSTIEGFVQHLNDLEEAGIGAGLIYSGEFGAELAAGGLMIDNIKLLAEVYDEGSKEVKVLKARENQSRAVKNMPVSALLMGSQDNILFDESIKKLFKREFSTKLARRSFFNFNPTAVDSPSYPSVAEMLKEERKIEDQAVVSRNIVAKHVGSLTSSSINKAGKEIPVSEDVRDIFIKYKRYNEEVANTIKSQFSISKIVRKHLQWKALKLAGAFAVFNDHKEISKEDYVAAANFVELLDQDMQLFEAELVKEPYEIFVDYMRYTSESGHSSLSLHQLRKLGYIPTTGNHNNKMKDLVQLATAYDKSGIYTVCEEGICYEEVVQTDICTLSWLEVTGTKEQRQRTCAGPYDLEKLHFPDLANMLAEDVAYSPFEFKDGMRGKDNILGGCKWIYLDIDSSTITDEECHYILQDINHHIARTSDPDNAFKFRVLLELDAIVDISDIQWKHFIRSVADSLSLKADILPKAQIAFSYAGRNILSVTDKQPIEAKEHIMIATATEPRVETKAPTGAQAKALLADELTTFSYAFESAQGGRSRAMIRAAYHAKDLGMPADDIVELIYRINNYMDYPLEQSRVDNTIISQIRRWR